MRVPHKDLPRYTWDQATILNLWPAQSFRHLNIKAGTIRRWASDGDIRPVGKGPNGVVLYRFEDVVRRANRPRRHAAEITCL